LRQDLQDAIKFSLNATKNYIRRDRLIPEKQ